jgi:uncharacterized Zn-finger protein
MADETDPECPICGRTMATGCLPNSCVRWEMQAAFDHPTRKWLPVDSDGFVLDGRRVEEVR